MIKSKKDRILFLFLEFQVFKTSFFVSNLLYVSDFVRLGPSTDLKYLTMSVGPFSHYYGSLDFHCEKNFFFFLSKLVYFVIFVSCKLIAR